MHSIPFSFPGFTVTEMISTEEKLIICATSQAEQAHCPACQQVSHGIHSYYQRCPRDLPISGQTVQLRLRVRRFRCLNTACSKQTFAEPLPDLVGRTSRRTLRLTLLWTVFAIQSGGEPEAQQVMDRWHVMKNWREALERVVSWRYSGLEQRLQKPSTPFKKRKKPRTVHEQAISDAARERRLARYEEVLSYYQQGLSIAQIATQAHVTRTTVYKYLAAESFPERHPRFPSPGTGKLIASYTA